MGAKEDIFLKVKDTKERDGIFNSLCQTKFELICKSAEKSESIFTLIPISYKNNSLLCQSAVENQPQLSGKIILQFMVGAEKYLMQATSKNEDPHILIDVSSELFHLQRRDDFRLKLPAGYKGKLKILEHNKKPLKNVEFILMDLSGGGCRVEVDSQDFELGLNDQLDCEIHLNKRSPISIKATAKHASPNPLNPQLQWFGLQFVNITGQSKNKIIAAVMDVYRELFTRS